MEHFSKNGNGIEYELTKEGFSHLIKKWTVFYKKESFYAGRLGREVTLQKLIETDVRLLGKYLIGEVESFGPFVMR